MRAGDAVNEFKTMVKTLHAAGIEVLLDVVYNHTAEGNHLGPTLSFRGIDNRVYYRLDPENPRHYVDYTGTGNTLNTVHPAALQLVMDSLRYWVTEMHVDGFRFDLAATLGRTDRLVDQQSGFFHCVRQDPELAHVKLIAEPWDLGQDGYQVGNFPPGWSEWNGKYRDAVRSYWKGDGGVIGELALAVVGIERSVPGPRPDGKHQFRHRARRIHAARPRQLQRKAQRGQRRRQPRRRSRQSQLELRRRRPDRRSGDPRAARAAKAEFPDDPAAVAGRADASGRRRDGPYAARQQQRLLPGHRSCRGSTGSSDRTRRT